MTDRDALYRAICTQPEEDTPRLAYADWLEEHGQPDEAEFIRVSCRLSRHPFDDPDYPELIERVSDLAIILKPSDQDSLPQLPDGFGFKPYTPNDGPSRHWGDFSRGFVDRGCHLTSWKQTKLQVQRFAPTLEQLFATTTIRTVQVNFGKHLDALGEFLSLPVAEQLRGLVIDRNGDGSERREANTVARLVAASPRLKNLRRLELIVPIGEPGFQHLTTAKHFGQLEAFSLRTPNFTPEGLAVLSRAAWFRGLRELTLDGDTSGEPRGMSAVAFAEIGLLPEMPRLASLHLEWTNPSPEAMGLVARSKSFPRLGTLTIKHSGMGPEQVQELVAARDWPLRHLHVEGGDMGDDGAAALAKWPLASGLRVLNLESCGIGAKGTTALAKSAALAGLRHLDLSNDPIGPGGLEAIAASKPLRGLRSFSLVHSYGETVCTRTEGAAFMTALRMPELRHLLMWGITIGGAGAKVIAESNRFRNLRQLMLEDCDVTDAAARLIFESPHLQDLVYLNLCSNKIGRSAELLARPEIMPKLAHGMLVFNPIPEKSLDRLANRAGLEL